ncbi:hypothetical protein P43SY_005930 [Pythium insidiosum]|uniref:G-patch domain-containing protein n=1 Tax=Pythium insidiosum TaxID=114742 RepID=A0AAD5Q8D4_PYTIN|nr:hypothetical protein P43SY_005930 [Pythium insidiosum]
MYFCVACNLYVHDTTVEEHDQSLAHMLSSTRAPSLKKVWLPESNRGYQLLLNMGWHQDSGLGRRNDGRIDPVATVLKTDRAGLGMPCPAARVTHFPPHDEQQQRASADGLSEAQRVQNRLGRKRKEQPTAGLSAAQRKQKREHEQQRDRVLALELYGSHLEGYEAYLR